MMTLVRKNKISSLMYHRVYTWCSMTWSLWTGQFVWCIRWWHTSTGNARCHAKCVVPLLAIRTCKNITVLGAQEIFIGVNLS